MSKTYEARQTAIGTILGSTTAGLNRKHAELGEDSADSLGAFNVKDVTTRCEGPLNLSKDLMQDKQAGPWWQNFGVECVSKASLEDSGEELRMERSRGLCAVSSRRALRATRRSPTPGVFDEQTLGRLSGSAERV